MVYAMIVEGGGGEISIYDLYSKRLMREKNGRQTGRLKDAEK